MVRIHRFTMVVPLAVIVALVVAAPSAASAATVVNGGFETGTFSGWTEQNQAGSAGSWFVYSGTTSPLSHNTIPAPPQGTYAAISDQTFPSANYLHQDVSLAARQRHILSFYVYYDSHAPIANPPSLQYDYPGANQQYRIDVMKPGTAADSLASSDILENLFATRTGDAETLAPVLKTFDLSGFAGQTIRLRAAQVDNENFQNAGLDAVTITSTPVLSTLKATGTGQHRSTLHGTVNPNGGPTTYHFQYGRTKHYGSSTPTATAGSDSTRHAEKARLGNLTPGTRYHFRIVATNAADTAHGRDRTFSTPAIIAVSGLASGRCTPPSRTLTVRVTSGDKTQNTSVFVGATRLGSASSGRLQVSLAAVGPGGRVLRVTTRSAAGRTSSTRHFSVCRAASFTG